MRKRHPTINQEREIGRQVGPLGEGGRRNAMVPLGELAGSLMKEIIRKRRK